MGTGRPAQATAPTARGLLLAVLAVAGLALFATQPLRWQQLGWPAMTLVVTFVLVPLLDAGVGAPRGNVFEPVPAGLARWLPSLHLPLQAYLLVAAARLAADLSPGGLLLLALGVGTIAGGLGITIAHELGHRASRLDRSIARILLASVGYAHFQIEHIRGHHVRVATPEDPATAPAGMSLYRFLPRTVLGGLRHAWRLEAMRLAARGRASWSPANGVLRGGLLTLAIVAAIGAWAGAAGMLLWSLQALWAVVLLETVNYIEHYALRRRRVGERYEPVGPRHSWNADFALSNWLLFNLQLHSDHHARMSAPYDALRSVPGAPQLPAGYPAMVVVAFLPPLWFRLMDPRLPPQGALPGTADSG